MRTGIVQRDRIDTEERLDPEYFIHPSATREWSVPMYPLKDVGTITRRERISDPPENSTRLDDPQDTWSIYPRGTPFEEDPDRNYLQWARPEDVLLHRSDPDKCFYIEERMLVSFDYWIIHCGDRILPEFLAISLRSRYIREDMNRRSTGHVRSRISKEELKQVHLPCPDTEKQQELIAAYREQTVTEDHRDALLHELQKFEDRLPFRKRDVETRFTVPSDELQDRLDPFFYQDEKYEYTGSGTRSTLEDVARISLGRKTGTDETSVSSEAERPVVNSRHLDAFLIRLNEETEFRRPEDRDRVAEKGDVVLSRYLTGNPTIALVEREEGIIISGRLIVIRPDEELVYPFYMTAYLLTDIAVSRMYNIAKHGTGRKRLSVGEFKNIHFPRLSVDKQKKRVRKLEQIHNNRRRHHRQAAPENQLLEPFVRTEN